MDAIVCYAAKDKCWNGRQSFGEICVHCGCCSKDKKERIKNRIEVLKEYLGEDEAMLVRCADDDEMILKNIRQSIAWDKRQIRFYEKKLEKLEAADG